LHSVPVDVNALVTSAVRLVERPLSERGISVKLDLGSSLPRALAVPPDPPSSTKMR